MEKVQILGPVKSSAGGAASPGNLGFFFVSPRGGLFVEQAIQSAGGTYDGYLQVRTPGTVNTAIAEADYTSALLTVTVPYMEAVNDPGSFIQMNGYRISTPGGNVFDAQNSFMLPSYYNNTTQTLDFDPGVPVSNATAGAVPIAVPNSNVWFTTHPTLGYVFNPITGVQTWQNQEQCAPARAAITQTAASVSSAVAVKLLNANPNRKYLRIQPGVSPSGNTNLAIGHDNTVSLANFDYGLVSNASTLNNIASIEPRTVPVGEIWAITDNVTAMNVMVLEG